MPLPKPSKGQKKKDWDSFCMDHGKMNEDFPDNKQRYAVCQSIWDESKKKRELEMAVSANRKGISHARSLINSGKVNKGGSWSFSGADGNKILGDNNWTEYSRWFLAVDTAFKNDVKEHYKYPFGKNGQVYRRAVIAAKQRAAQQGANAISAAADGLLQLIDKGEKSSPSIFERRMYEDCEIRAIKERDGSIKLGGSAIVYNQLSDDLGGFRERVAPGAAIKSIRKRISDVRALHNHDKNFVWGRQSAKTIKFNDTPDALDVTIYPDEEIGWQRDLLKSIERGDINQMSFGFLTLSDSWEKEGGANIRTLNEIQLIDVSTVTFPAYPQTNVGVRAVMERAGIDYEGIERALIRLEHSLDLEEEDRGAIADAVETLNSLIPQVDESVPEDEESRLAPMPRIKILNEKRRLRNRIYLVGGLQ